MDPIRNYTATKALRLLDDLLEIMPLDDGEWCEQRPLHIRLMRNAVQAFRDDLKEELFGGK